MEKEIIRLAQIYSQELSLKLSSVSTYAANDGKFFSGLENGKTCTLKRLRKTLQWFSDNWPVGLEWPSDIARPAPLAEPSLKSPQFKGAGAAGASHIPAPSLKGDV